MNLRIWYLKIEFIYNILYILLYNATAVILGVQTVWKSYFLVGYVDTIFMEVYISDFYVI